MRKLSKVLVVICALVIALSLSACGSKDDEATGKDDTKKEVAVEIIEGKFILSGMKEGEQEISKEEILAMGGNEFFIEFMNDSNFIISVTGDELKGSYVRDGETVTMTMEGEEKELVAKLVGNDFVIDDEGVRMTFTKE